jgi:hypothetical protein
MPRSSILLALEVSALASLTACATPRLHSPEQLSTVALRCGLQPGDLIQEHDLKKVLILLTVAPKPAERACVYKWARKRHLRLAVIDSIQRTPN